LRFCQAERSVGGGECSSHRGGFQGAPPVTACRRGPSARTDAPDGCAPIAPAAARGGAGGYGCAAQLPARGGPRARATGAPECSSPRALPHRHSSRTPRPHAPIAPSSSLPLARLNSGAALALLPARQGARPPPPFASPSFNFIHDGVFDPTHIHTHTLSLLHTHTHTHTYMRARGHIHAHTRTHTHRIPQISRS
jgi:hypothetical protein